MSPGDAFWLHDHVAGADHVHVVLTHPEPDPKTGRSRVAVVNLTTARGLRYDRTVTLTRWDHEALGDETRYVLYSEAGFEDVEHIDLDVERGHARPLAPFRPDVFERICEGIFTTPFDPPEAVLDYCFERMPGDGSILKLT